MGNLGSGPNGELTFLDILSIVSFLVGLQNLDLNISQEDIMNTASQIDKHMDERMSETLKDIHSHLSRQDEKLERILSIMEANYDKDKETS